MLDYFSLIGYIRSVGTNMASALVFISFVLAPAALVLVSPILKNRLFRLRTPILLLILFVVAYETVLRRSPSTRFTSILKPFAAYSKLSNAYQREMIILNICMFVPVGLALPWSRRTGLLKTLRIGFLISFAVELSQLIFSVGYFEVDDLINNTLGTLLGYLYWRALFLIKSFKYK